jgi:biopolymer transport protein ExbD
MKRRRLRKEAAHLEITAFINLVVVLVPFLLSTAVFTRLAVIDLSLPAKTSGVEQLKENNLQLEVVIRKDAIEVSDRIGGLIQRIPAGASGHDLYSLAALMVQLKAKFPDKREASVLAEPETPYDTIVQVMDAMRMANTAKDGHVVKAELFPSISLGDAPVRGAK